MTSETQIPLTQTDWAPAYRIIPSRFPPIDLFEKVTDPADLEAVFQIEAMTNQRLRDEVGDISLVPPEDRVSGPGSSAVMAAFTHIAPDGARFSTSMFGAFYCALELDTAIAETRFHRAAFLAATDEPAQTVDMRVYAADLSAELHDVRGATESNPELYDPDSYAASQKFAQQLRAEGSDGVLYNSVRHDGGECAAVFRPRLLTRCRQTLHLGYVWNGSEISDVFEKRALASVRPQIG
ncbi:RES family NAD+ phosphorylase [Erythrobacter sp. W53]|uniref:RES family NAD+ phosphorylase n=1 Tax=Erythrobacter sp. W53 TaxID=3425947 RepID=UPI003D767B29